MVEQEPVGEVRGRVVIISSQHGMIGPPGHVAYAASKGGVVNFVHQVAVDFGPRGVLVNAVAPGKILTGNPEGMRPELLEYSHARTPFHRLGRPDDVAGGGALPRLRRRRLRERDESARRRRLDGVLMKVDAVEDVRRRRIRRPPSVGGISCSSSSSPTRDRRLGEVYAATFAPDTVARMIEDVCERHVVGRRPR